MIRISKLSLWSGRNPRVMGLGLSGFYTILSLQKKHIEVKQTRQCISVKARLSWNILPLERVVGTKRANMEDQVLQGPIHLFKGPFPFHKCWYNEWLFLIDGVRVELIVHSIHESENGFSTFLTIFSSILKGQEEWSGLSARSWTDKLDDF